MDLGDTKKQVLFYRKHKCYGDNLWHNTGKTHFIMKTRLLEYLDSELGRRVRYGATITLEESDGVRLYYVEDNGERGECIVYTDKSEQKVKELLNRSK